MCGYIESLGQDYDDSYPAVETPIHTYISLFTIQKFRDRFLAPMIRRLLTTTSTSLLSFSSRKMSTAPSNPLLNPVKLALIQLKTGNFNFPPFPPLQL